MGSLLAAAEARLAVGVYSIPDVSGVADAPPKGRAFETVDATDGSTRFRVLVDPVADPASGTFGVRLELPNPDTALLAGVNCTAHFVGGAAPVAASEPEPVPGPSPAREAVATATEPEPAREPEPELEPTVPDVEEVTAARQCFATGPIASAAQAAEITAALEGAGATARVREAASADPRGYIVLARQPPDSSARVMAAELRARGVEDIAQIATGRRAGRVSLGVYGAVGRAERRRAALAELGVATEIERLSAPVPELRIAIEAPGDEGEWRQALEKTAPSLGVHAAPCGELLAARG